MITEAIFTEYLVDYEEYLHQKSPVKSVLTLARVEVV
jgi:hypothetical protein